MGNLVSQDVEGAYSKLCEDLVSNDPERNQSGVLHWATPPLKEEQLTHFIQCLSKNTTLRKIVLQDMEALPIGKHPSLAKALKEHSALTCLGFKGRLPKEDLFNTYSDMFLQSSKFSEFEIENSIISGTAMDSIISLLKKESTVSDPTGRLTSLSLKGCQVAADDIARLTCAIKESAASEKLQELEITLKPPVASPEAAQNLADFFAAADSVLQIISLAGLLEGNVPTLMKSLKGHQCLQQISLKGRGLAEEKGMEAIGAVVSECPRLAVLDLSESQITSSVGCLFAKALQQAPNGGGSLHKLFLSRNSIGDEGAIALAKSLEQLDSCTSNLQVLDVRLNQIGPMGIAALANSMQKDHVKLQKLCIGEEAIRASRRFEKVDVEALTAMIEKNKSLHELHMADATFEDQGLQKMLESLAQNKTILKCELACATTASLQEAIRALPKLHLHSLSIRAIGETQLDQTTGDSLLGKLDENKSLREFIITGLKESSESVWKGIKPKVESMLLSPKHSLDDTGDAEESSKRTKVSK